MGMFLQKRTSHKQVHGGLWPGVVFAIPAGKWDVRVSAKREMAFYYLSLELILCTAPCRSICINGVNDPVELRLVFFGC